MCVEKGDSQELPKLLKRRQRSSKWDEISVELNGTAVVYTKVNDKVDICSHFQWLGFSNEIPHSSVLCVHMIVVNGHEYSMRHCSVIGYATSKFVNVFYVLR